MQTEDKKRAAHRALQDRILNGEGRASPEQRARAFSNAGLSQPLDWCPAASWPACLPSRVLDADRGTGRQGGADWRGRCRSPRA